MGGLWSVGCWVSRIVHGCGSKSLDPRSAQRKLSPRTFNERKLYAVALQLFTRTNSFSEVDILNSSSAKNSSSGPPKNWLAIVRILIAIVVVAAIGFTIWNAVGELREKQFQFSRINYLWWVAAIACFIASMALSAIFWHRLLGAMDQQPTLRESMGAFFISQLGKYVPGKAMVVVLRTDRIRSDRVTIGPAIVSVFIETLTWVFTGSIIASVLLFFRFENRVLQAIAVSMMVVAGVLTAPPVIRWFAHRLGHVKGKKTGKVMLGLTAKTMAPGWLLLSVGWCLSGLSLWLVLNGLPDLTVLPQDYWLCLTCVTLAGTAGFVSLLPGGLGVRELVMIPLLSTRFDSAVVVVAVVAIRMVWLVSELFSAAVAHVETKWRGVG